MAQFEIWTEIFLYNKMFLATLIKKKMQCVTCLKYDREVVNQESRSSEIRRDRRIEDCLTIRWITTTTKPPNSPV